MKRFVFVLAMILASAVWAQGKPPAPQRVSVSGEVLEVRDVDAYSYLRLKTAEGETWAAVTKTPVKKGQKVTIENATVLTNFESKTLKQTFPKILFGSLAGSGATTAAAGVPHGGMAKPTEVGDVKVPKATGADARTVAEIVTDRVKLKNKTVVVRAKVVKVNRAVMGKNWIHLQDGSGSAAQNTHDVLVTTKDEAKVGDVVVVKGVVRTDVELGAGYSYKVLVESTTLQK